MAKGWDGIEQQTQATQAARARFAATNLPDLKVNAKNQGPYVIRFLEQGPDVNNYPVHAYQEPDGKGGFWHRQITCLREVGLECPACRAGMKQKRRGVYNVIQRNRPVLRKGQDGKAMLVGNEYIVDGYRDEVVIASVGGPTAEMLRKTDGTMGGLMSRDWQVSFSGDTFQSWSLTPVLDGAGNSMATPMSEADFVLAGSKHDLDEYMKPPTPGEVAQIVAKYGANSGAAQVPQSAPVPAPINPMLAGVQTPTGAPNAANAFGGVAPQQG